MLRQRREKVSFLVCYSLPTARIAGVTKASIVTDIGEYQPVFSLKFVPRVRNFGKVGTAKIADEAGMKYLANFSCGG
jgi:hypothetical protein